MHSDLMQQRFFQIEQWNKIFGRWVNRGARGIAVFADENRSRQRLTHYFDISDTH